MIKLTESFFLFDKVSQSAQKFRCIQFFATITVALLHCASFLTPASGLLCIVLWGVEFSHNHHCCSNSLLLFLVSTLKYMEFLSSFQNTWSSVVLDWVLFVLSSFFLFFLVLGWQLDTFLPNNTNFFVTKPVYLINKLRKSLFQFSSDIPHWISFFRCFIVWPWFALVGFYHVFMGPFLRLFRFNNCYSFLLRSGNIFLSLLLTFLVKINGLWLSIRISWLNILWFLLNVLSSVLNIHSSLLNTSISSLNINYSSSLILRNDWLQGFFKLFLAIFVDLSDFGGTHLFQFFSHFRFHLDTFIQNIIIDAFFWKRFRNLFIFFRIFLLLVEYFQQLS